MARTEADILALVARAAEEGWTALDLSWRPSRGDARIGDALLIACLERHATKLGCLTELDLAHNDIGAAGARAIAERLKHLTSLNLAGNRIGSLGARAIAKRLTALTDLNLACNDIGAEGARAIAEGLTALTDLNLGYNWIRAEGARAIAAGLIALTSLNLWENNIGDEGARAIAGGLKHLTRLNLCDNNIGAAGARVIAEGLTALTDLNLADNWIGAEGARAIAGGLTALTDLDLAVNRIGAEGARAIARGLKHLTSLNLADNRIRAEGARAIAGGLKHLTSLDLCENHIRDEGARAIATGLTALTDLDLAGNRIGAEGAKAIARRLTALTDLDLAGNRIGAEGAKAIARRLTALTDLDLARNEIGDEGARAIARGLKHLTSLDLCENHIGPEGARAIAASLKHLTRLDLWHNNIGDEGARAIAEGLTALTDLNLARNDIGAEGARAIAAGLTALTFLNLDANDIGAEGARAIAGGLTALTFLDLEANDIGAEGARAIAGGLKHLTSLNLWHNKIGDEGARAIAEGLTALTDLNLARNDIGAEGARAIAGRLKHLTSLNLWDNNIEDEGARAIAGRLTALTRLHLAGNRIGDEGALAIAGGLKHLTSLNLAGNQIGDEGARAIAEAIQGGALGRLAWLDLTGNDIGLPDEVLRSRNPAYIARELLGTRRAVHKGRVMVVGEAETGKTWLCTLLFEGKENGGPRVETHHFEHIDARLERDGLPPLHARVWHFGGQHVLHGTHELFFEARTLYLLVLDATRTRAGNRLDRWLRMIRHFAGDHAPVVVAVTKCDRPDRALEPLEAEPLRTLHPGVEGVVDGLWSSPERDAGKRRARDERLAALRAAITEAMGRIEDVNQPVGEGFLRVREAVRARTPRGALVGMDEFRALCAGAGETEPRFQDYALRRLHVWGDLFYFAALEHERDEAARHGEDLPAGRRARMVRTPDSALERWAADPRWISRPIYEIARASERAEHAGRLTRKEIERIVRESEADMRKRETGLDLAEGGFEDRFRFVLAVLAHVEMCFPLGGVVQTYFFPRGLPERDQKRTPDELRKADAAVLEWKSFVLESVLHRFMVRRKSWEMVGDGARAAAGGDADRLWRRGGVVTIDGTRALVEVEPDTGRFEIRLDPQAAEADRNVVLRMIRDDLIKLVGREPDAEHGFGRPGAGP